MQSHKSFLLSSAILLALGIGSASADEPKMNVLFILADDMRPELGCYGVKEVKTPHLDKFASTGVLFQNAYCNIPVSGASRASMLTGLYPQYPDRFTDFASRASVDCPEAIPVSEWFTQHGYYTVSDGKVFHHIDDHADTWSEPPYRLHPKGYDSYWAEYNRWELWMNKTSAKSINPKNNRGPFCEWAAVPDTAYADGKLALRAIADLKRLKKVGKPFFLACGFWKPHLPFNAPKKYWDLYDREKIPMADNRYRSEDLPKQVRNSGEIYSYAGTSTPDDIYFLKEVKHGYYACLSYVDTQIGKVLDALDEEGLADSTIVVFLGDHGWHLGEHGFLGKHNLMRHSTHVPLMVRVPGMKKGETKSMVEFVDLYPTLCELCGLPVPGGLDGTSFVPVLKDLKAKTKDFVYVQWGSGKNAVTSNRSYTEWIQQGNVRACMLFDHDVDLKENKNRAKDGAYRSEMLKLSEQLHSKLEE